MIWKFIYLSLFLFIIWFGLTQLEDDTNQLSQQSSQYTTSSENIIVRFFAVPNPNLSLALKAEVLGRPAQSKSSYQITYKIDNIGHSATTFLAKLSLQNPEMRKMLVIKENHNNAITIQSGKSKTLSWEYTTKEITGHKVDTIALELRVKAL